ncbi:MAG TPA: hypothetical protein PK843_19095 [bacterium]|nr:hypothetical protein [bacterium]
MLGSSLTLAQIIKRALALWILFLGGLNLLYYLPHEPRPFMSWANFSLYFLLGVVALYIVGRDRLFRDVYGHFGFTFLFTAAGLIIPFTGKQGLFGDNILSYYLSFYNWAVFYTLLLIGACYLTLRYLFWRWPRGVNYALSVAAAVGLNADFWHQALTVSRFPFKAGPPGILPHILRLDAAIILLLLLYCAVLLFTQRPNGAFLHTLVIGLLLSIICDVIDILVALYQLNVYGLDQYFAMLCLLILLAAFFLRLISLFSPEHALREQFMFNPHYGISIPVVLKSHNRDVIVELIKTTFSSQNVLFQFSFGIGLVLISGLAKSFYITIKLFMMLLAIALVWNIYYYFIYSTCQDGQILNKKFIK